jgi:hypothetical protein
MRIPPTTGVIGSIVDPLPEHLKQQPYIFHFVDRKPLGGRMVPMGEVTSGQSPQSSTMRPIFIARRQPT